ncbi:MAG: hypothetical protein JSW15_03285 [Deltaproteobacteria bacterium]|jgi:hypothetical protein|nr:MAG: hypothetical protein JSW15_03285 [Deltaproteobacteria bacterium]
MDKPSAKEESTEQLRERIGEVAEHRAARWLEELDEVTQRSAKERLVDRMDEVAEDLAGKWLKELDARLSWLNYREDHDDFCYGVGFGECEDCKPEGDHLVCPNYEYCKAEFEAEWPEKKS